jgi:putative ABC transport system substrate-binding protein
MRLTRTWPILAGALAMLWPATGDSQAPKLARVGVVYQGGSLDAVVDGLKAGLKESGLEEGKHFALELRDLRGDLKAAGPAARDLERQKVDLIFTNATSVTQAVKRATSEVPIVFSIGSDPVAMGLVQSIARPGGRLTGIHFQARDVTPKRLELLKETVSGLRRVVTFYDPQNASAAAGARLAREAARQLGIELVEQHVSSIGALEARLKALPGGAFDAYLYVPDAMVASQAQRIIDAARTHRLPTAFHEPAWVDRGALLAYGVSYREIGRQSARYVERILAGASPKDLPVESVDRLELGLNLGTARELGLVIPPAILIQASTVIR